MLLEKCIYDLNLDFVIPADTNSANPTGRFAYNLYAHNTTTGLYNPIQRLKLYTPTFFIMHQRLSHRDLSDATYGVGIANYNNQIGKQVNGITEELPKSVKLVSGSSAKTMVFDTRELITYGQYQLFVTSSSTTSFPAHAGYHDAFVSSSISMNNILDSGLVRDAFDVVEVANSSTSNVIKIRNKKMNVPVKITNKHDQVLRFQTYDRGGANVGDFVYPILKNEMQSRSFLLDGANRAIVNGYSGLEKANKTAGFSNNRGSTAFEVELDKNLQSISPYLIFPDDELIFGMQFPVSWDLTQGPGGVGGTKDVDLNEIKIQDTKVKLIGSQIQNNKEFHEGLNQNLTSNAIHEAIGSEPVVDQFQTSNSATLTGSFLDQYPYHFDSNVRLYGGYIHQSDTKMGFVDANRRLNLGNSPLVRVNKDYNSVFSLTTLGIGPLYTQINRFFNLSNVGKIYNDARIVNAPGAPVYGLPQETTVGSYSSMQYYSEDGNAVRRGGNPQYYFNCRHFGNYSDLIRQARDSKFVSPVVFTTNDDATSEMGGASPSSIIVPTTFETVGFNLPPVRARFVEQRLSEDLNLKEFIQIKTDDVDNTSYLSFQSSNISPYVTSSLPFFDDGIIRNRNYAFRAVEVSF